MLMVMIQLVTSQDLTLMLSGNRTKGVIEIFGNMSKNPNV